jgi:hypothetical protein
MAILAPAPLASPQLSDCIGRSGRVLQTRGQTPSATPAPYSTRIQQRHRPRAAPRDFHRLLTCPSDRERPRCREFASRGSGVRIPSAPPVSAGQRPARYPELVSLANHGEPTADLSAAGNLACVPSQAISRPRCPPPRSRTSPLTGQWALNSWAEVSAWPVRYRRSVHQLRPRERRRRPPHPRPPHPARPPATAPTSRNSSPCGCEDATAPARSQGRRCRSTGGSRPRWIVLCLT